MSPHILFCYTVQSGPIAIHNFSWQQYLPWQTLRHTPISVKKLVTVRCSERQTVFSAEKQRPSPWPDYVVIPSGQLEVQTVLTEWKFSTPLISDVGGISLFLHGKLFGGHQTDQFTKLQITFKIHIFHATSFLSADVHDWRSILLK